MREIHIVELKDGYKGKPFDEMIRFHLKKHKQADFYRQATLDTIEMLPPSAREIAMDFIDNWLARAYDKEFWATDTSVVFSQIIENARTLLMAARSPTDDETLFNMFQTVVLSYAYNAAGQPKMRKFIGI